MALNLGSKAGNPGYSFASPKMDMNSPTGYAQPTGPVWVGGAGSDPRGPGKDTLQDFYNWKAPGLNTQVGDNPNIIDYTQFAAGNQSPVRSDVMPGQTTVNAGGMNPQALESYWQNNPDALGQAINQNPGAFGMQQSNPMANAINNNQQGLEDYWNANPDALDAAIAANPGAFGFTPGGGNTGSPANPVSANPNRDNPIYGDYGDYVDMAFGNAMRTLDPYIDQTRDRFEQSMINRGMAPSSEGYNESYDHMTRGFSDLLNDAAFQSMGFGAGRMDADRGYGLQRDTFDLNELMSFDNMNRAWDAIDFRNAGFNASREDQQFNQLMSMFGFTPTGSSVPNNTAAGFQNQYLGQLGNYNAQQNMYQQLGQSAQQLGGLDWGSMWGDVKGLFGGGGGTDPGLDYLKSAGII